MNISAVKKIDLISEQILDSIADGVFTVDTDWNITFFNKAAEIITGVSKKHALGQKCWEVFHAEICERDCFLKRTLKSRKPYVNKTIHIINLAGKKVPVSISTSMLCDKDGSVLGGVETFRDISEIELLRKEVEGKNCHHDILTINSRMLDILNKLPIIAESDTPVLITGESGTGKELFARAVHNLSGRASKPFIAINCGALPENLLESELFGYRKGAFTDAKTDKPGRFDLAKGGTLFLDEIGDMLAAQAKVLRALQNGEVVRVGSEHVLTVDVRLLAATNKDLSRAVQAGTFREDLRSRLDVFPLRVPALRHRSEDIPILAESFVVAFCRENGLRTKKIDPSVLSTLASRMWPGNVRELKNVVERAAILSSDVITVADLPEDPHESPFSDEPALPVSNRTVPGSVSAPASPDPEGKPTLREVRDAAERAYIVQTLAALDWNVSRAAVVLGVERTNLHKKIRAYEITRGE